MNSETSVADSELRAAIALGLVPGVGPRLQTELTAVFGSCAAVLRQSVQDLREAGGVSAKVAAALQSPTWLAEADRVLEECQSLGIRPLLSGTPGYPRRLLEICDYPRILFQRGVLLPQDELAIAIVGSRRCTAYGLRQAERLGASLARAGLTVVSGLARGIDQAAQRAAVRAGGRTLAILPAGVQNIYPPEHADFAAEIVQQGALLSEMSHHQQLLPGLFPQRNRIISGLSLGVLVIEASRRSGALYTARHALEQGRDVFAVPGPVDSLASAGCLELLRDGVQLVRHADDVLEALGPLPQPAQLSRTETVVQPRELSLNTIEKEVLNQIGLQPCSVDAVLRGREQQSPQILATLTVLEVRRLIRRLPGNQVVRY
ncbi:MAG TPA: DNA-protecting protein DprA [Planctomycetaceae bacterium]|nr:DNA-protecting protein DprA [Planctomycetaceae bacterium]